MKKTWFLSGISVVFATMAAGLLFINYSLTEKNRMYSTYLQNQYQRILYDLTTNMDNVEVSLSKALVANSTQQRGILFGDVWNDSKSAQYKLNALPVSHSAISNTSKFIAQVADYSYAILKNNSAGKAPTAKERKTLQQLRDYSGYVRLKLREFTDDIGANGIDLNELGSSESSKLRIGTIGFDDSMTKMSEQIQQYPTLLYDGPFSENVLNIKPRILEEKEIKIESAVRITEKLLGKGNINEINWQKSSEKEKIPVYSFLITRKGKDAPAVNIDISKNGGKILYMLDPRAIVKETVGADRAIRNGISFLKENGFSNMVATYTLKYDGVLVVNYVKKDKGILLYPDQVKLKIALDNGAVIGVESRQYLIAAGKRIIPVPGIDINKAKSKVSTSLKIMNSRLTLIPMESLREILCYEFYGEYDGQRYFVYINALNGNEERILKVVDTQNGELTM